MIALLTLPVSAVCNTGRVSLVGANILLRSILFERPHSRRSESKRGYGGIFFLHWQHLTFCETKSLLEALAEVGVSQMYLL